MAQRNSKRTRIPELSGIEIRGSVDIAAYSQALRGLGHDIAWEVENAADEVEARLRTLKGHPMLMGVDVRITARRVANRLRRAQECAHGLAIEAVKFNAEYRKQFVEAAEKPKKKPTWEL
jgi:hypothetical protein